MDFAGKEPPDDVKRLRREIEGLRQRLEKSARKGKQLSSDTELLVKKTKNLKEADKISCGDPNWRQRLEDSEIGPGGIWISDLRTAEDIQFVAEFAGEHQLSMTYGNRSFYLSRDIDD